MLTALHHVQLAIPTGAEDRAWAFYGELLEMIEVPKPKALAQRGGLWFETGNIRLHLGVEDPFIPAKKAHPAFQVVGLDALFATLHAAGVALTKDDALPGYNRFYAADPFGNRLEFLEPH